MGGMGHHSGAGQPAEAIRHAYATYYSSGHYDQRYPGPNPTVWRRILDHVTPQTRLVDYGCGSGRYLLALRPYVGSAAGFDISAEALGLLAAQAQDWEELAILGPDPALLERYVAREGQADVVLCLFGVLAHITDPAARHRALEQIARTLKPGAGRLLISVPNAARRFKAEQRRGDAGRISYTREMNGQQVAFAYQLYTPARLTQELSDAGLTLCKIGAESVFSENWLLTKPWARALDAVLTPLCPARWGYGIYAEVSR